MQTETPRFGILKGLKELLWGFNLWGSQLSHSAKKDKKIK